jgi:hypothetical protein
MKLEKDFCLFEMKAWNNRCIAQQRFSVEGSVYVNQIEIGLAQPFPKEPRSLKHSLGPGTEPHIYFGIDIHFFFDLMTRSPQLINERGLAGGGPALSSLFRHAN